VVVSRELCFAFAFAFACTFISIVDDDDAGQTTQAVCNNSDYNECML
jgi:hypothetical protein